MMLSSHHMMPQFRHIMSSLQLISQLHHMISSLCHMISCDIIITSCENHYIIPWSHVRYGRMDQSLMLLMNKFVLYDPIHLNNALRHLYLHLPLPVGGGQWHTTWHNTRFTLTIAKDVIKIDLICLNQLDASRPFRNCVMLSCWVLVTTHKITWSFHDVELCHLQQVSASFLS